MRNKKTVWLFLIFFLVALLGTMGWVTRILLDVDRDEQTAHRKAALEQNTRLALWRMEARLNALLSSLPILPGWAKTPEAPIVVAGFRMDRTTGTRDVHPPQTDIPTLTDIDRILNHSPKFDNSFNAITDEESERNRMEALSRFKVYRDTKAKLGWHKGSVILVGETMTGQIIGWVLDWPRLQTLLIDDCIPLVNKPGLLPLSVDSLRNPDRDLTNIPLRLDPGTAPAFLYERTNSPARMMLLVSWSCIFLPAAGLALLLFASYSLNERRDAFVSAVTHELRTPLTTFSMYTEMLEGGMVPEAKRSAYLATLRREAIRLNHLVENVLAYARIERGRKTGTMEHLAATDQLERLRPQLLERCERAGMRLEFPEITSAAKIKIDPAGFDRILLNLIDNACKYAAPAEDKRIHLELNETGQAMQITIRDHGPGVGDDVRKKLFKPFSKSDRDAAGKVPGVGLGLALCRQLCQRMGGTLKLDTTVEDGACFRLTFPL